MGFFSWLRGNRAKRPPRPWVRPEFLGLFMMVVVASVCVAYWSFADVHSDPEVPLGQTEHAYVGIEPTDLGSGLPCEPSCYVERLLGEWLREHPEAQVVGRQPRYHEGVLIGYDVAYRMT